MESDKFISVRETVGGPATVAVVDFANPQNVVRRSISADHVIHNPEKKILAMRCQLSPMARVTAGFSGSRRPNLRLRAEDKDQALRDRRGHRLLEVDQRGRDRLRYRHERLALVTAGRHAANEDVRAPRHADRQHDRQLQDGCRHELPARPGTRSKGSAFRSRGTSL